MSYQKDTIILSEHANIQQKFEQEVIRLLSSGAVDINDHSRGLLFGVALENIADNFLRGERKSKSYKNLKRF